MAEVIRLIPRLIVDKMCLLFIQAYTSTDVQQIQIKKLNRKTRRLWIGRN